MALRVFTPLCLFLLVLINLPRPVGAAAGDVLPVLGGLGWKRTKNFQAPADLQKNELRVFLSGLVEQASHLNASHLTRQEKIVLSPREPFPQPTWEKAPCKSFFWKTFSSC